MKLLIRYMLAMSLLYLAGCKDNNPTEPEEIIVLKAVTAKNINATASGKTYFRFRDSTIVTGSDTLTNKWDIAFKSTTIYTNSGSSGSGIGGAVVLTGKSFDELKEAPVDGYKVDATSALAIPTGSGNGWYKYAGPPSHLITPIPGVVIVIKTGDGKYTKVQIVSYYKDAPENPAGSEPARFYTFKYFYQPDGSRKLE